MVTIGGNKPGFIILFAAFGAWVTIEGASLEQNVGYCAAPKVADNFDIQWANDHSHEGWYITVGNQQARKLIYEILQGKNLTENSVSDYSDMCTKFTIDVDNSMDIKIKGKYFGYGDKSADWNCDFEQDNFQCKFNNHQDHPAYFKNGQAYLSYFDGNYNHNIFVAVLCLENGVSGWFAASLTKTISKEEKEEIYNHLQSIGFDPNAKVDLYADKCA